MAWALGARAGNYVIQYLVEHGTPADASLVMQAVLGFTAQLSQQKYSSNVVEKCLIKASTAIRKRMLHELSERAHSDRRLFASHLGRQQQLYLHDEVGAKLTLRTSSAPAAPRRRQRQRRGGGAHGEVTRVRTASGAALQA